MVCKNCHSFKVFGKKCWFYWDDKKICTQFKKSPDEEPGYKEKEAT